VLLGQVLLLIGAVTIAFTPIAAARGVLPMNRIIGFRVPAVLASEDTWREGHRAAIRSSMVGGCALLVAALASFAIPEVDAQRLVILASCIVLTGTMLWGTRQAVVAAKRVAADVG
jgi:hypothetical protein